MEKELEGKTAKTEKVGLKPKKDIWEIIQALTPLLIPLSIAIIGWYFTNQHNQNQIEIQRINNENQLQVALINSNVGQSGLIKDFMQDLTSKDTFIRNIAIEAILYAAPTPGKRIVDIIAKSNNSSIKLIANDALEGKRSDLVENLYSVQKTNRITAANEIQLNWQRDNSLVEKLIKRAENGLTNHSADADSENGIYNTIVVLSSFPKFRLMPYKTQIKSLLQKIPADYKLTQERAQELSKKLD